MTITIIFYWSPSYIYTKIPTNTSTWHIREKKVQERLKPKFYLEGKFSPWTRRRCAFKRGKVLYRLKGSLTLLSLSPPVSPPSTYPVTFIVVVFFFPLNSIPFPPAVSQFRHLYPEYKFPALWLYTPTSICIQVNLHKPSCDHIIPLHKILSGLPK